MKESTGYKDRDGNELFVGDIVRFYFDENYGYGTKDSGYTEMIDVIMKIKNEFYLVSDIGSGAFVWRHCEHGQKIGTVEKNTNLLVEGGFSFGQIKEIEEKTGVLETVVRS